MPFQTQKAKLVVVALSCLALGAGASAIASAGAATGTGSQHHQRSAHGLRAAGLRGVARHAVHGRVTIATRRGFETISFDRGRVDSVSGNRLTLTEGSARTAHRTVTLTIPATARVRDDRRQATLSALRAGQRVLVITAPKRTLVRAHDVKQR